MRKFQFILFALALMLICVPAQAAIVNVDLSGAASGSYIDGGGADFAQAFFGQTVVGTGIVGAPTGPLTLNPSGGLLSVAYWDGSNSILPQPNNQAPLSILLESAANAIGWRMGSADGGTSVTIDFFDAAGGLVHTAVQTLVYGYNDYFFSGFGTFAGLTIRDNNDSAGLRYQNFSYDAVPIPGAVWLLGSGLLGLVGLRRRMA